MVSISAIGNMATKAFSYAKKGVKIVPDIIFGDGADTFVKAANNAAKAGGKTTLRTIWNAVKAGGSAVKNSHKTSFFSRFWKSLKTTPSKIKGQTLAGARLAKAAGKNQVLGGVKGFFKGIGKKMPMIGNLMLIAFELPNIISAIKEKGIGQGVAEVGKAGARLTGASLAGAAAGAAFGPVGSLVGWIAGEWLTGKIVGKSYSEKKAEDEQKKQELAMELLQNPQQLAALQAQMQQQPVQQPPFTANPNYNFGMTNPVNNFGLTNNYSNDIMMQQIPAFNQIV